MKPKEELLMKAGLKKKEAQVLNYLLGNNGAFSRDLEHDLRMRQPEASIALTGFGDKGWVKYKNIKGNGKGRPQKKYTLAKSEKDILTEISKPLYELQKEINESIEAFEEIVK